MSALYISHWALKCSVCSIETHSSVISFNFSNFRLFVIWTTIKLNFTLNFDLIPYRVIIKSTLSLAWCIFYRRHGFIIFESIFNRSNVFQMLRVIYVLTLYKPLLWNFKCASAWILIMLNILRMNWFRVFVWHYPTSQCWILWCLVP